MHSPAQNRPPESPPVRFTEARFLAAYPEWKAGRLPDLPQVCVLGRSNVGKSSLLNALVEQKGLARTSSTPGRTQELVVFAAQLRRTPADAVSMHLVDLPGYGFSNAPAAVRQAWGPRMEAYLGENPLLRAALLLVDVRREPAEEEFQILDLLARGEVPTLVVVTKVDKVPKTQRVRELARVARALELDREDLYATSAAERFGLDDVRAALFEALTASADEKTPPEP